MSAGRTAPIAAAASRGAVGSAAARGGERLVGTQLLGAGAAWSRATGSLHRWRYTHSIGLEGAGGPTSPHVL